MTNSHQNGAPTTTTTNSNRQHNGIRSDNNKIQPKCTKAMDMRFQLLCDRESQDQFKIYWQPEKTNLAD
jgi:hypothetical protein